MYDNSEIRVLFLLRHIFPNVFGGSARYNYYLIKELIKHKIKLTIVLPIKNYDIEDTNNITLVYVPYGRSIRSYSKNINKAIDISQYDMIYSDGLAGYQLNELSKKPIVFNHHGFHMFQKQHFLRFVFESPVAAIMELILFIPRRYAVRLMVNKSQYVISLGGHLTDIIKEKIPCPLNKIIEIPNAVLMDGAKPVDFEQKEDNSFLFVGNIEHRKGISYLLDAIKTYNGNSKFYIVGNGPLKKYLMNKNKMKNVNFIGRVSDKQLNELYTKVQCLIFPSLQEGMPTVILEAMKHGMIIIASNVGSTNILVDEKNGLLVIPGDSNDISNAIKSITQMDKIKKRKLSNNSYERVLNNYNWTEVGSKYLKLLKYINE